MITESQTGLIAFTEALAKTLVRKGVFEKSELVKQLEKIRDQHDVAPAEQTAYAAEIDSQITKVREF